MPNLTTHQQVITAYLAVMHNPSTELIDNYNRLYDQYRKGINRE